MMRLRSVVVLAVVTLAAVAAAVLTSDRSRAIPRSGELVFPGLLERINQVTRIEGRAGGESFTLVRENGRWVVPERDGYDADSGRVQQLLLGAAGLQRIEPKTGRSDRLPRLGLGDPDAPEGRAVRFALWAGDRVLAEMILGNRRSSKVDPDGDEIFVMVPGEPHSWLAEGRLPTGRRVLDWVRREVVDVDRSRVREVRVTHGDGTEITVYRESPDDEDFRVAGIAPGAEIRDRWPVTDIGRSLADVRLEDVIPSARVEPTRGARFRVEMRTFDGLVVRTDAIPGRGEDEGLFATFEARFDPDGTDDALLAAAREARAAADGVRRSGLASLLEAQAVHEEVERYNRRWEGWSYRLPEFKILHWSRGMEDLVVLPQAPEPAASEAPGTAELTAPVR